MRLEPAASGRLCHSSGDEAPRFNRWPLGGQKAGLMLICRLGEPVFDACWQREVLDLEPIAAVPRDNLKPVHLRTWTEALIERSLLRRPELLARAIGVPVPQDILALRQVAKIDLYLRINGGLHLFELKKPTAYDQGLLAAKQIVRQWDYRSVWLRRGGGSVNLWAVCPVRWSLSKQAPKIPEHWMKGLADIRLGPLADPEAPELNFLFYSIVQSDSNGRLLLFWRADEPVPTPEFREAI